MTVTRKIVLGGIGAGIALLALWFFFLWGPQGDKLAAAEEREDVAATTNAELVLKRDRLAAAQEDAPALLAAVETLRTAVPDDANLAQFLLEANDAATASGVDFLSIAPTPPTASIDPTEPSAINLAISVDGGYFQVLDYLNRLADLDRIVVVDTLNLAPSGDGADGPVGLAVSLAARMFTTATPDGLPGEVPAPASPASTEATPTTTTTAPEATS